MSTHKEYEIIRNINDFKKQKDNNIPISMITCYDYSLATIVEKTEIDSILVGDSVGMVFAGYDSTIPVTVGQMVYHTEIVRRGAPSKFLICDLPFMSYHVSVEDTMRNCGKIMKETGANAVKLEGGRDFSETIKALTSASIPVCGHLGLTPQSIHKLGGFSVQGRSKEQRDVMLEDAKILEDSGIFALVLEMVPEKLADEISKAIAVPTIGIGAGRYCNGQVLVINDMLGLNKGFNPKFLKKYAEIHDIAYDAIQEYNNEVRNRRFPTEKNIFE